MRRSTTHHIPSLILAFLLASPLIHAQVMKVESTESHLSPASETGSTTLDITGGTPPYQVTWDDGSTTTQKTALTKGDYSVTVVDATGKTKKRKVSLGYAGIWDELIDISADGNQYANSSTDAKWGTALSSNFLESGKNGFVEFQVYSATLMSGMGYAIPETKDGGVKTILHGFAISKSRLGVVESGEVKALAGTLHPNDRLRVERQGKKIIYSKNGVVVYESQVKDNKYSLQVKLALGSGATAGFDWFTSHGYFGASLSGEYVELKRKLDGAFTKVPTATTINGSGLPVSSYQLKFTYEERYATDGVAVNWNIYDWQRNSVLSNTITNDYGKNWESINVTSLNAGEYYVLEVAGINKGETYYLRFKR